MKVGYVVRLWLQTDVKGASGDFVEALKQGENKHWSDLLKLAPGVEAVDGRVEVAEVTDPDVTSLLD